MTWLFFTEIPQFVHAPAGQRKNNRARTQTLSATVPQRVDHERRNTWVRTWQELDKLDEIQLVCLQSTCSTVGSGHTSHTITSPNFQVRTSKYSEPSNVQCSSTMTVSMAPYTLQDIHWDDSIEEFSILS
jgi:hypothetical protein